ncbi:Disintegrin And Metalloproteinase Domain-Containing Protein 5-Like [Manis pentadactyla]|nr:Disintegrin And Metalloproteinase Domain-Containing Protein 5-Like [Manis pentadactyla]
METVSGFVHIIYEEENDNPNIHLLGDNDTYSHNNLQYQDSKSSEYPEGLSLESYTISIVQLLGFNVELSFDDSDTCYSSVDVCTMSPEAL